jgi:hypothetical protein
MAKNKDLVPYSKLGSFKSKIRVSGQKLKKAGKKVMSKTTAQQRFLGKTLPKGIFKVGKAAFMNPVYAIGLGVTPGIISALGKQKGLNFPEYRQFNKKGRKI